MEHGGKEDKPCNGTAGSQKNPVTASTPSLSDDKRIQIITACDRHDGRELTVLATSPGGLLDDDLRQRAWPILLGHNPQETSNEPDWLSLPRHHDEDQVKLDVDRSFVYYPMQSPQLIARRKEELQALITQVLRRHPFLNYFQGYHDIVQVFLLVLGPQQSVDAVRRLSLLRVRDFMLPSMSAAVAHLHLLPSILQAADMELYTHISKTEPFFALTATLTMYAHDIQEYSDIARLFDFLIAHSAVLSLYLFAAIVVSRRTEFLAIPAFESDELHFAMSKLPKTLDLDGYITRAMTLYATYPPHSLPKRAWARVSKHSVLKTTTDIDQLQTQTLEDGHQWFEQQARQMARQKVVEQMLNTSRRAWLRSRRPATALVLAIAVGALAYYMGNGSTGGAVLARVRSFISSRRFAYLRL